MRFETQSLRSHSLYLFIKRVNLLFVPRGFGFPRISLAHFIERFLNGELCGFGHDKSSSANATIVPRCSYASEILPLFTSSDPSSGPSFELDQHQVGVRVDQLSSVCGA
jgi:hypothetical protein